MRAFLQTLFFFLLVTQICFTQWVQNNLPDRQTRYPNTHSKVKQLQQQFEANEQILNKGENYSLNDPVTAWIKHYASGLVAGESAANDITLDAVGNIYITGFSEGTNSYDYVTVKYNPSGTEEWVAIYNGSANRGDIANAIAVDESGNVYVTGYSDGGLATHIDCATIKYSPTGTQLWVSRYTNVTYSDEIGTDIDVDQAGNIYVTGNLGFIIKYTPTGNMEWVSYGGLHSNAIDVDAEGNVYVTGSWGSTIKTVKFSTTGISQWAAIYNGPTNGLNDAFDLAIDVSRNVYVTGWSMGIGTACDYVTIKYDSLGTEEWVARYDYMNSSYGWDRANAIAVDAAGYVYVTGFSDSWASNYDYATIKYSPTGNQEWVARYNGSNWDDEANAIAVDLNGNVYVTGMSGGEYATIKYSPTGTEEWVSHYSGAGVAITVDTTGNVFVTGSSVGIGHYTDCATIKYSPMGTEEWVSHYQRTGKSIDGATEVVVDTIGNVYVTGWSECTGTSYDYITIKYSTNGNVEWIDRYNGPGNSEDKANAISLDGSGNVYVTGLSRGDTTGYDFVTIKYGPNGTREWVARYNSPENYYNDEAVDIDVDNDGNIYVTGKCGYYSWWSSYFEYATIKYSPNGMEQWVAKYSGPGGQDIPKAIIIDSSGNVYVTGIGRDLNYNDDYTTIKYNSTGNEEWVVHYDGPGNGYDEATAITVDVSGNVYVTGISEDDYATIKYSPSGTEEWVERYNGPGNGSDRSNAIAIDLSGNVYITGFSYDINDDYATIKYNSIGTEEWVTRYNGTGNENDAATAMVLDASGNIYITGSSTGSGTFNDYTTIKYDQEGNEKWVVRYNGSGNKIDEANAIAIDNFNNVYITGVSKTESDIWSICTTIKYTQDPSPVEDEESAYPTTFALEQNYPNPFNPSTTFRYSIPQTSKVVIKVYDILGNEIVTLMDEEKSIGTYELTWNATNLSSGIYFYQLKAGEFIQTKKMLLLK